MSKPLEELFTEILAPRVDARYPGTDNMTAILVYFHNNQHLRSYQAEKLKVEWYGPISVSPYVTESEYT